MNKTPKWQHEIKRKHEEYMRRHTSQWGPLGQPMKRKPKAVKQSSSNRKG